MANVVIDDSSLHAIGDALRGKLGESHTERRVVDVIHHPEITQDIVKIAKTSNATGFNTFSGNYGNNLNDYQVVTIPGAAKLRVTLAYQTESTNYDYLMVDSGDKTGQTITDRSKYGGTTLTQRTDTWVVDTLTFYFHSDSSNGNYLGYYAEVIGLDADGNILQETVPAWDEKIYEDVEVPNVYKPRDMADAIKSIKGQMNYVTLTRRDNKSFDISPYVDEGDNFILFFSQSTSNSTSSDYYNCIYTSFFPEDRKRYKHKLMGVSYNKKGFSKWSELGSASLNEQYPAIGITTGLDTVTQTYENGIITNSNGVGISAILVYPC